MLSIGGIVLQTLDVLDDLAVDQDTRVRAGGLLVVPINDKLRDIDALTGVDLPSALFARASLGIVW